MIHVREPRLIPIILATAGLNDDDAPPKPSSRRLTRNCALGRDDAYGLFATQLHVLATRCARVLQIHSPQKIEGAGKTGCALHPRSHVQGMHKQTHMSIQVQRKQSGLPCAMVLRLISCSPRRDLACLSPSPSRSVSLSRT